ncbi:MAG: hypothetical protein M3Q34_04200 [bacterium]|nr:hypothetical protein [bacterium]
MSNSADIFRKIVYVMLAYLLFWWIFYGIWFLIPYTWFSYVLVTFKKFTPYYVYGFVPLLSLMIPIYFRRKFQVKKRYLIPVHIVFIVGSVFLFFLFSLMVAYKNFVPVSGF